MSASQEQGNFLIEMHFVLIWWESLSSSWKWIFLKDLVQPFLDCSHHQYDNYGTQGIILGIRSRVLDNEWSFFYNLKMSP